MKKGVFKARLETGRIVEIEVERDESVIRTRGGVHVEPGMIELSCPEYGCKVNPDLSDPTLSRFTLVFPQLKAVRLEDSPFPEV